MPDHKPKSRKLFPFCANCKGRTCVVHDFVNIKGLLTGEEKREYKSVISCLNCEVHFVIERQPYKPSYMIKNEAWQSPKEVLDFETIVKMGF